MSDCVSKPAGVEVPRRRLAGHDFDNAVRGEADHDGGSDPGDPFDWDELQQGFAAEDGDQSDRPEREISRAHAWTT